MKIQPSPTFADSICYIRTRKIKKSFFDQVNKRLDWEKINKIIDKHYTQSNSATGNPSYEGLLLFKMCLLQTGYGLSDYKVEDRINDSILFSYFCGLPIDQVSPDHSTLRWFRTVMTQANAYESLFKEINAQLEAHHIIVKKGVLVEAPLKPRGKTPYKVSEDRTEQTEITVEKQYPASV